MSSREKARQKEQGGSGRYSLSLALAVLLLLCPLRSAPAQGLDLRYLRHQGWTTEDGLPQDSVHGIAQTADGYLWIGTEGGLARFDGAGFRGFQPARSAGPGEAAARLAAPASEASGSPAPGSPALVSGDISSLLAVGDALWVGTADGLVRVADGGDRMTRFSTEDGLPSTTILSLERDGPDGLKVETSAGWAVWRGRGFAPAAPPRTSDPLSSRGSGPWRAEAGGVSWAAGGLHSGHWMLGRELPGSRLEALLPQGEAAWAGTNAGLSLLRGGSHEAEPVPALRGDTVLVLFPDREGDLWIGTENAGLHVLRTVRFRTEPSLAGEGVAALVESGGAVWAGTRRDGVRQLRGGRMTTIDAARMTSPVVLSMAPARDGAVWVGTPDGLNRVGADGGVRQVTSADGLPDDYVLTLADDGAGGVWAGTRRGLARIRADLTVEQVLTRENGLAGDLVGALQLTRAGVLWIATSGGLTRREKDGTLRSAGLEAGAGPGAGASLVRSIAEGPVGDIWLATGEGWVSRVPAERSAPVLRARVAPGGLQGLLVDDGMLWLRSERGISAVPLESFVRCAREGCVPERTEYGVADGMPSAELAGAAAPVAWRMGNGELWFGTRHGVAIVNPAATTGAAPAPPVVIERFTADGTELATAPGERPIAIPYGPVRFTLEYAGLSFAAPSRVHYRYRLDGLDDAWTEVGGRRSATYTNLRPGQYRFEVQASSVDGHWAGAGAAVAFRVIPPIYRRWWFLLLLALCGAAVIVGLYLLRLRRLRREFDAVLRERNRMAREIHDTLAQDFVGVSLKLDIVAQLLKRQKVEAAEEQVREARVLVTEGLAEARQSIWGLRANAAADSLPARFDKLISRFRKEGMEVRWKVGGAYREVEGRVELEVLRVGKEALENVRRHAGVVEAAVELQYRRDMLVLTVEDQGRGFAMDEAAARDGHYGVRGMRERAAAVGGQLHVKTAVGEGTRVELVCPIAEAQAEVEG